MREFGFKLSVIAAPVREDMALLSAVLYPLLPGLSSLKRYVFKGLIRVPPCGSHLERFSLEIVLSLGSGAQVLSRPRVFSSGSRLGTREPESLHFYSTCFVHIAKTTTKADSKSKLCPQIGHFELLAAVL